MPIDTTPSTVATSALQAIPFSSLIGGPLGAAIEAQSQAAMTSWEFIDKVGLTGPADDKRAVTVDFNYISNGKEVKLIVPILAIVPIPYIAVDEMSINFKANISASASNVQEDSSSQNIEAGGGGEFSVGYGPFSAKANFQASYSSKKDSKASQESKYSVEYTMDISVHAKQSDMPAGLATILNILQSSITPTIPEANLQVSPAIVNIDPTKEQDYTITVTVFNKKGVLVKNQEITVDPITLPAGGLTVTGGVQSGTATLIRTDKNGTATLTFKVTPPSPPTPPSTPSKIDSQTIKLSFKVTDKIDGETPEETVKLVIPEFTL
ncbi:DUF2589 domain-containing protein [Laspinema olomoucense]|uniref:DUF2589 domain-containing protein n=1 Tax=Laspinema olomoucense D3b TaxID=2953688 RepID=A0ABT2NAU1_9CYAN|nr:DUF2589 domain-containing protein [Laspinema sp. D3b]MCT7979826.1 DUF2589 domain-containing protein [Laspinema sp. D3b]